MSIENLKKILKEKKVTFGSERTLKLLRRGELTEIFIASNCPKDVKADIMHYAKLSNVKVIELEEPNDELGIICKKPFSISVLCY